MGGEDAAACTLIFTETRSKEARRRPAFASCDSTRFRGKRTVVGDRSGPARRAEHEAGGCVGQAQWPRLPAGEQQLGGFQHRLGAPAERHQPRRCCGRRHRGGDGRPVGFLQRPHRQDGVCVQMDRANLCATEARADGDVRLRANFRLHARASGPRHQRARRGGSGRPESRLHVGRVRARREGVQSQIQTHQPHPRAHRGEAVFVRVSQLRQDVCTLRKPQDPHAHAHG